MSPFNSVYRPTAALHPASRLAANRPPSGHVFRANRKRDRDSLPTRSS
jgi:hypothetical protein